jgi:hypothetical protein
VLVSDRARLLSRQHGGARSVRHASTVGVPESCRDTTGRLEADDVIDEMLYRLRYFEYGSAVIFPGCLGALGARNPKYRLWR